MDEKKRQQEEMKKLIAQIPSAKEEIFSYVIDWDTVRDHGIVEKKLRPWVKNYVFSNFFSNFWLIAGKLWEARSRLYRRQSLQVNSKYVFESSWRDLHDLDAFAPFDRSKF